MKITTNLAEGILSEFGGRPNSSAYLGGKGGSAQPSSPLQKMEPGEIRVLNQKFATAFGEPFQYPADVGPRVQQVLRTSGFFINVSFFKDISRLMQKNTMYGSKQIHSIMRSAPEGSSGDSRGINNATLELIWKKQDDGYHVNVQVV